MSSSVVFRDEKYLVDRKITTCVVVRSQVMYVCCSDRHFFICTRFTLNLIAFHFDHGRSGAEAFTKV